MQKLIDKLILFFLCLLFLLSEDFQLMTIVVMLVGVGGSALCSYLNERFSLYIYFAYFFLCLIRIEFIALLPLIIYDIATEKWYIRFSFCIPILFFITSQKPFELFFIISISALSLLLRNRTESYQKVKKELFDLLDTTKENSMFLENKNQELMEKQDYEVRLATLGERNRIAREIHDNVGHLLTRSILQIGAMQVSYKEDEHLKDELENIKDTLSDAMTSVRESVHDLHEEAIDLPIQISSMIESFSFCPVKFDYDAESLPKEIKYCFLAIVREALSNIAKHSNAKQATITIREHPALYQLIVSDNGNLNSSNEKNGIGLVNMKERVESFNGIFRIDQEKGFKIFISIPKAEYNKD